MNPLAWAATASVPERQAIDLFLHATRVGILDFEWGALCKGCSAFLRQKAGLRALSKKGRCPICVLDVGGAVGDDIEVSFTVNRAVRPIRFHDPDSLDFEKDGPAMFTSHWTGMGPLIAKELAKAKIAAGRVRSGAETARTLSLESGRWLILVPELHAGARFDVSADAPANATFEAVDGTFLTSPLRAGEATMRIVNRMPEGIGWMLFPDVGGRSRPAPDMIPAATPFLTGRRLLASQTFRELFRAESLPSDVGLEVRSLTMLFTDLKGSTQLYERIGDLRAFDLVRKHFDVLRGIVIEHGGAVVKTIGDAVMATFHSPANAVAAAIAMHDRIERVGSGELLLKIGAHDGACIAVDLNERLDYFGQTVNIAARVQALADAGEIVVTEAVFDTPGVEDLVRKAELSARHSREPLKGIDAPMPVVRLS